MLVQTTLLPAAPIGFDPEFTGVRRLDLGDGAWLDHRPGWLGGHQALFDHLVATTVWRAEQRPMYDRIVDVPRGLARFPDDGPGHPVLDAIADALSRRYRTGLTAISAAYYRDGRDGVAMHGDKHGRDVATTFVCIVSVGEPRRMTLRPAAGGAGLDLRLGWGDLLVMGGTCQRTWRHGIPKARAAGPRISVMFRPSGPPPRA